MFAVMVVGAGRIGASIAKLLHNSGDYDITVADHDTGALERMAAAVPVRVLKLDVERDIQYLTAELRILAAGRRAAVLSACSFDVNRFMRFPLWKPVSRTSTLQKTWRPRAMCANWPARRPMSRFSCRNAASRPVSSEFSPCR